jgi:hypothetical protein
MCPSCNLIIRGSTDLVLRFLVISVQRCKVNITRSGIDVASARVMIRAEYSVNDERREGEHQGGEARGMFHKLIAML